jgi:hypothetical protein
MGLVCQHDFERTLSPGEIRPLIDPGEIHAFWHLKQQRQLQDEAKILALKFVIKDVTEGTFYTHYVEDPLVEIAVTAMANTSLVPVNEYLGQDAQEILREMSPDAVIIQEPVHRPHYNRRHAKKRKRTHTDIRRGLAPGEEIVRSSARSGRWHTGAELATQRALAKEKADRKKATEPRHCKHCGDTGHDRRTCELLKTSQAADRIKATQARVATPPVSNIPAATVFRNVPREMFPQPLFRAPSQPQQILGVSPYFVQSVAQFPQQFPYQPQAGPSTAPIAPSSQSRGYYY